MQNKSNMTHLLQREANGNACHNVKLMKRYKHVEFFLSLKELHQKMLFAHLNHHKSHNP